MKKIFPLGDFLKKLRIRKGVSLRRVEKATGVSNAYLWLIENGNRERLPKPDRLIALADYYNVSIEKLLKKAGYDEVDIQETKEQKIEKAFLHAISDPDLRYGMRLKDGCDLDIKLFIIWIYKKINRKEVKKLKYFETKVVKVKKEKEKTFRCKSCGTILPAEKKKGNWVNGENLDKIKFPCFCRWADNGWIGMLIKDWKNKEAVYTLVRVDEQTNKNHTYGSFKDLKEFIEKYDIHILKGKIIIFEEE